LPYRIPVVQSGEEIERRGNDKIFRERKQQTLQIRVIHTGFPERQKGVDILNQPQLEPVAPTALLHIVPHLPCIQLFRLEKKPQHGPVLHPLQRVLHPTRIRSHSQHGAGSKATKTKKPKKKKKSSLLLKYFLRSAERFVRAYYSYHLLVPSPILFFYRYFFLIIFF
jgi:hypothetical protein